MRTCDGFYFPISYSTVQSKFADDEKVCQAMCPASEVALYSHRNPGEDISQAVSSGGRNYSELPNAFAYRKAFNPSCACKASGETWAEALKHLDDPTVERGDIIVNEERARQLSQPQVDAQGKPIRPARPAAGAKSAAPAAAPKGAAPAPSTHCYRGKGRGRRAGKTASAHRRPDLLPSPLKLPRAALEIESLALCSLGCP